MQILIVLFLACAASLCAQPSAPEALTVYRPGHEQFVRLDWQPVDVAESYTIYYSDNTGSGAIFLSESTDTTFIDNGLHPRRFYRVSCTADGEVSPLSNQAGYVRFIIPETLIRGSSFVPFGIPLLTWHIESGRPVYGMTSLDRNDVFADQLCNFEGGYSSRVIDQTSGQFFTISPSCSTWNGALNPLRWGRAYWVQLGLGDATGDTLLIFGEVDTTGHYGTTNILGGAGTVSTPYTWRDARIVPRHRLNLLTDGFRGGIFWTSDRVLEQHSGEFFWYDTQLSIWRGHLRSVTPGRAYWIQNKQGADWQYTYTASGAP